MGCRADSVLLVGRTQALSSLGRPDIAQFGELLATALPKVPSHKGRKWGSRGHGEDPARTVVSGRHVTLVLQWSGHMVLGIKWPTTRRRMPAACCRASLRGRNCPDPCQNWLDLPGVDSETCRMAESGNPMGVSKGPNHTETSDLEAHEIGLPAVRKLCKQYRVRAHRMARAQFLASKRTQRMHNWIGIPVVVLSAIVGTSIFATISSSPTLGWVITVGLISVLATTLAALQTFFGFGTRAQQHKVAGAKYSSIMRALDLLELRLRVGGISPEDALAQLIDISGRLDETDQESPDVPDRTYNRARDEQKAAAEEI
jgi:hypothetical protein